MRFELREFQSEAVRELASRLDSARRAYRGGEGQRQAVGLTATTGAGKTIIATALIERIIFGSDDEGSQIAPDPGTVFLWMTDLPQLNAQTQGRMLDASSELRLDRLTIIEGTFNEDVLAPGRVYFLNTQLLGAKARLVKQGPLAKRSFTFWDVVRETIGTEGRTLCLVVDEAHRGMTEGKDLEEANSIIQRFIKGYPEAGMPPVPIVLGISATPRRFLDVVENSGRTVSRWDVPPDEVRASGLIKQRTAADYAGEKQTDAMALLVEAAKAWKASTEQWAAYYAAYSAKTKEEPLVVPALIIQVENEGGGKVTQTDLAAVAKTVTDVAGPLPDSAFVHAFGETADVPAGGRTISYLEPSRIAADPHARVVFYKTSLGTGWDCPRAEVMLSFRKAVDPTSIGQTIGRMVRAPLARKIEEDERLNSVDVFLPYYNRRAVDEIVAYLHESGGSAIAEGFEDRRALMSLPLRLGAEAAVAAIEAIPTYVVPTSRERHEVLRLRDLARSLSKHGLDPEAFSREIADLAAILAARREALADNAAFQKAVNDQGEIVIGRVEWDVGEKSAETPTTLTIPASDESIRRLFAAAGRALSGDLAAAYAKARIEVDPHSTGTARLEAFALSQRPEVLDELNAAASARIDALFAAQGPAIEALSPAKREDYRRIRRSAPSPSQVAIRLPGFIQFTRGEEPWPKHLYADPMGSIPLDFTSSWEADTLREELANPEVAAWLRNVPNEEWALRVPWHEKNAWRPFFPDFLLVREVGGRMVVDVVDPHDHTRPDAVEKAKGLATYARDHGHLLGHIDLVAKVDGRYRRLHLEKEQTRKAVDSLKGADALAALYSRA